MRFERKLLRYCHRKAGIAGGLSMSLLLEARAGFDAIVKEPLEPGTGSIHLRASRVSAHRFGCATALKAC